MTIRLDRLLAETVPGLSRAEAKKALRNGSVKVDGVICKNGDLRVDPETSVISMNDKPVAYAATRYFLLNKPAGVLSATRDGRQKTVLDLIPGIRKNDYFPVGRLDKDTEGLLLITNDGALAHELLSPKKHVKKTYIAVCEGTVGEADADRMEVGLDLGDFTTAPAEVSILSTDTSQTMLAITITEGKFHQVKRMVEAVGSVVLKLRRIRMGGLWLPKELQTGESAEYDAEELKALLKEENEENLERLYRSYL